MRFDVRTFQITAGTPTTIERAGRYFSLVDTSSPVDIVAKHKNSPVGQALGVEQGIIVPVLPDGFQSLVIESSVTQTIRIAIADDPVTMFRLSGVPEVSNTDLRNRSRGGSSFVHQEQFPSLGPYTNQPYYAIYNPPGSGKLLVVTSIKVGITAGGLVNFGYIGPITGAWTSLGVGKKKYKGSPVSAVAELYAIDSSGYLGYDYEKYVSGLAPLTEFIDDDSYTLAPSQALGVEGPIGAADFFVTFHWYEE